MNISRHKFKKIRSSPHAISNDGVFPLMQVAHLACAIAVDSFVRWSHALYAEGKRDRKSLFGSTADYRQHCTQRNAPVFKLLRGRF